MALLNHAKKELSAKIVYYGPGLSGKTTNLEWIHRKWEPDKRGKLISLETKTDRTLFFDFLPVQIGEIAGYRTRFNVYTVPGQIFYNETRKMVLKGVDGVVFVADSQKEMASENVENLKNLAENLRSIGKDLHRIPMVLQFNKRDLPNTLTVEEMNRLLNQEDLPFFEAIAVQGEGVLTTLTRVTRMVADDLKNTLFARKGPSEPTDSQAPVRSGNVHPFPVRPSQGIPPTHRPQEDGPAFLSGRTPPTPPAPAPEPSLVSGFQPAPASDLSLGQASPQPNGSLRPESPSYPSRDLHDLGDSEAYTLNEPLAEKVSDTSGLLEEEAPLVDAETAGYTEGPTGMATPDLSRSQHPGAQPADRFGSFGLGLSVAQQAEQEVSPEPTPEEGLDPSLIVPAPASPVQDQADGFSVLLGNPERGAANEIRIPLSIRREDSGETFGFHVLVRIDPKG